MRESAHRGRPVGGSGYNIAVEESQRDDFPNNLVGDLVPHRARLGRRATNMLPRRPRLHRPRLVGQLGVVHLQRPTHGVALLVRHIDLRAGARAALPNPRHRPSVDVGRRATAAARRGQVK